MQQQAKLAVRFALDQSLGFILIPKKLVRHRRPLPTQANSRGRACVRIAMQSRLGLQAAQTPAKALTVLGMQSLVTRRHHRPGRHTRFPSKI